VVLTMLKILIYGIKYWLQKDLYQGKNNKLLKVFLSKFTGIDVAMQFPHLPVYSHSSTRQQLAIAK
jgi:hypothetical protein